MGMILSEPITQKETYDCLTSSLVVGSSSMQGWRDSMEDAHSIVLHPRLDPELCYFAVFDGHGGKAVSEYVSKHLHRYIMNDPQYVQGYIQEGIENAFLRLDRYMQQDALFRSESSGSTAVLVLIKGTRLFCANAGDSRAVAFANGEVIPLSFDHKPSDSQERDRIFAAGGFVSYDRVNGDLALTRAFGDFTYKQNPNKAMKEQVVTCFPDVIEKTIDQKWEFIVLACDGIWDVMTNEQVCQFVRARITTQVRPDKICEQLMDHCIAKEITPNQFLGTDNMTAIIVVFRDSVLQPYKHITDRTLTNVEYTHTAHGTAVRKI